MFWYLTVSFLTIELCRCFVAAAVAVAISGAVYRCFVIAVIYIAATAVWSVKNLFQLVESVMKTDIATKHIRKLVVQFQTANGQNLLSIIKCRLLNGKQKNRFIISKFHPFVNLDCVDGRSMRLFRLFYASIHSFIYPLIHSSCAIIQVLVHKSLIEKVSITGYLKEGGRLESREWVANWPLFVLHILPFPSYTIRNG